MAPLRVSRDVAESLLSSALHYILLDIDGVIWTGAHVLPGIPETLRYLRARGKAIRFLSNNASVSRRELCGLFHQRGMTEVAETEVYNSAYAAALRLRDLLAPSTAAGGDGRVHGNVFVIGEKGLHEELQAVLAPGYFTYGTELHQELTSYDAARLATAWEAAVLPPPRGASATAGGLSLRDLQAVAVVVGLDLHFHLTQVAIAAMILQGPPRSGPPAEVDAPRAAFIVTNEDPQIPVGAAGVLLPGAGVMAAALRVAAGRAPEAVCGKPHGDLAALLFTAEGITRPQETCLMVGDRLTTDIAFGRRAGCQTLFVLSGAEGEAELAHAVETAQAERQPDYVADSLASLSL